MTLRVWCAALMAALVWLAVRAEAQEAQPGFERWTTPDGTKVGIWYPAVGTPVHLTLGLIAQDVVPGAAVTGRHPLVVISHGDGGSYLGHADTAVALARAGFIVAALTHPGDNWQDDSRATQVADRPRALSGLIDAMLRDWHGRGSIDAGRIGAFGFSIGGFTVLAAAGGRPDLAQVAPHCTAHPDFYDCRLLRTHPVGAVKPWADAGDPRIKAIVVAAPALGFAFGREGLAPVRVPVQLWRADKDQVLPAPFYADAVLAALPVAPEFHTVPGAGHFDFLAPCVDPSDAPAICRSAGVFDREAFHKQFDAEVVGFFRRTLQQ